MGSLYLDKEQLQPGHEPTSEEWDLAGWRSDFLKGCSENGWDFNTNPCDCNTYLTCEGQYFSQSCPTANQIFDPCQQACLTPNEINCDDLTEGCDCFDPKPHCPWIQTTTTTTTTTTTITTATTQDGGDEDRVPNAVIAATHPFLDFITGIFPLLFNLSRMTLAAFATQNCPHGPKLPSWPTIIMRSTELLE